MRSPENLPTSRDQRRSAVSPFDALHNQIDRIFSDFSRGFGMPRMFEEDGGSMWGGSGLMPSVDMHEAEGKVMISAELPGVDEKDIDISVEGDMLTISGEKKSEMEQKSAGGGYHSERSYGRFSRSIGLPFTINADAVDARFDKGVLKLTVQKPAEAQQNVKKIQIRH